MSGIRCESIDHCSVLITDLGKARAFYVGVLGLREIPKPKTFDFVALWFQLEDGQTLHLLRSPQPDTRSPRHAPHPRREGRTRTRSQARSRFGDGPIRTATAFVLTPTATASS